MAITSDGMSGAASITSSGASSYRVLSGATLITTGADGATINSYVAGLGAVDQ